MIKLILQTNAKHIEKSIKSATDHFAEMESRSLAEVDIEGFLKDYVSALLIFDGRCFSLKEEHQP